MIRLTGQMICAPHEVAAVARAAQVHIRLSRAEPGCRSFSLEQSGDDPCRWEVDETFANRAAFEAHQARTRDSDWWRITGHMVRRFEVTE